MLLYQIPKEVVAALIIAVLDAINLTAVRTLLWIELLRSILFRVRSATLQSPRLDGICTPALPTVQVFICLIRVQSRSSVLRAGNTAVVYAFNLSRAICILSRGARYARSRIRVARVLPIALKMW
jgi:hypothetical protein